MFEGKSVGVMGAVNRMSFPVQTNSMIAKMEEENTAKEAPVVAHV